MTLDELQAKTLKWSKDRGILTNGKITTQALKLGSEIGELMDNAAKDNLEAMKDDIGDCLVVLTNLANLAGTTLEECWEVAYNDIKDRKGFLNKNGNFIKSTDKNYAKLLAEFEAGNQEDDIIAGLAIDYIPEGFYTYHIRLVTATDSEILYRFELNPHDKLPNDLPKRFLGKSVAQLEIFLGTIGELHVTSM